MKIVERLLNKLLGLNLQIRLVAGFLIATCLTGSIATLIGIWTINRSTIDEVQNRVRRDIHTAKHIYDCTMERIEWLIRFHAEGSDLHEDLTTGKFERMEGMTGLLRNVPITDAAGDTLHLDVLTVVDMRGKVLYRATNPGVRGDSLLWDPLVQKCIDSRAPQSSTELIPLEKLHLESPSLAERAEIETIRTPESVAPKESRLTEAMMMRAAHPIRDRNHRQVGVLVGGLLLSRDRTIVDKIKETVARNEQYDGREIGIATIFQDGVRISTNVMTPENQRAVGTLLSKEVYDRAVNERREWVGRDFVVNDWYITTYAPIYNSERKPIGILYTGILDAKYRAIKWRMILINLAVSTMGVILAFFISFRIGNTIIKRIRILKQGTEAIAAGNLDYRLAPDRLSGFDLLDEAFNNMSISLKDRDERLQKAHEQLMRSEKLAALGQMAAGVAHEINNPLGGILLYSNLVLEDISEKGPARDNMQKIVAQTNRCKNIVQGLLDFARAPTGEMIPLMINDVVRVALNLVKEQSMFLGIDIETRFAKNLGSVIGDPSRLEEVFLNLFINAAHAMRETGGKLSITTSAVDGGVRVVVQDTGRGIDGAHLPHIFDPFFTTKEPGQGTGLGLSIAYGVIQRHKGSIDAESSPGQGAAFTVFLPFAAADGESEGAGSEVSSP